VNWKSFLRINTHQQQLPFDLRNFRYDNMVSGNNGHGSKMTNTLKVDERILFYKPPYGYSQWLFYE
jgi:hypothetical protein